MRISHIVKRGLVAALWWTTFAGLPAAAQTLHIAVGPLTTPADARAFDQRLGEAVSRFCSAHADARDLDAQAPCRSAVRAEALAQLSPEQQLAFAQRLKTPETRASAR